MAAGMAMAAARARQGRGHGMKTLRTLQKSCLPVSFTSTIQATGRTPGRVSVRGGLRRIGLSLSSREIGLLSWLLINMTREHLLRRHTLPIFQCERCFVNFETHERFQEHLRQLDLCIRADPQAHEGISKFQESQLRKRGKKTTSDEERWIEMYKILFPEDSEIPSPCKVKDLLVLAWY